MKFAVVGSGIAGLVMAHALKKRGHEITLYSDRTGDAWLASKPTGGAGRFRDACLFEESLGLAHWNDTVPMVEGVHLTLSLNAKNRVLTAAGRVDGPAMAVDVRLQSKRWMQDLEVRGGRIVIGEVTPAGLDAIAAEHDLTMVAVGRGPLCNLFARDEQRSLRNTAPRKLAAVIVKGIPARIAGVPYMPVKFNIAPEAGEAFWTPFLHMSGEPCWLPLIEAIPGGPWDRFGACKDGDDVLREMKQLVKERLPWDYDWIKDGVLADPQGWIVGEVLPSVRGPAATLPSGRSVLALGDTAVSVDPCAGQGANNGSRMVRSYLASIDAHKGPFDAPWMRDTFEHFWNESGERTYFFSDMLTKPMPKGGQALLTAQYGSTGITDSVEQKLANAIGQNFVDPTYITDCFVNEKASKAFIAKTLGRSPGWHNFKKTLAIGKQQLRQALGLSPRHPC